MRLQTT